MSKKKTPRGAYLMIAGFILVALTIVVDVVVFLVTSKEVYPTALWISVPIFVLGLALFIVGGKTVDSKQKPAKSPRA